MSKTHCNSTRRHDFVFLFDVQDGNPNGDPDAGNLPRVDPETMQGIVTDVCLKRKVRNYVDVFCGEKENYKIYVQNKEALNTLHERAYTSLGIKSTGTKQKREDVVRGRQWMCQNFYDIRTFGAVMSTGVNCGQVRGPIQLTFARSVDPILPLDLTITRIAVTKPEDMKFVEADDEGKSKGGKVTEMGRKAIVSYGLYICKGFYNPLLAKSTGFNDDDLSLFWQSLENMWEIDRSASRGLMTLRHLYIFTHSSELGNCAAHTLFDLIKIERKENVSVPRAYENYDIMCLKEQLPEGIDLTEL